MLTSAHQGYIYQDILGAYFVAKKIASGDTTSSFDFDIKKTREGIPDRFDDIVIYENGSTTYIQVKHGSGSQRHSLIKGDFSSDGYGLALDALFQTWQDLNQPDSKWHVCLAWDKPIDDESILDVLSEIQDCNKLLPNSICYKFDCENLWPQNKEAIASWKRLKQNSTSIDRVEFKKFLDDLIIEIDCPKTSLLQDLSEGIELLLSREIEKIGVGEYPNDHVNVREVVERLCSLTRRLRAKSSRRISISEIEREIGIVSNHGGIEQKFPIDFKLLVDTPYRINQVVSALGKFKSVVLTAEPGSGKSWFIENLSKSLEDTIVVKHYCYIALEDPLATKRITVNALYGSLMTQILSSDENLPRYLTKRYASNLEQLNLLLKEIKSKTLIIVDGIDHIWRVYQKNRGGITEDETTIITALGLLDLSNPNVALLVVSQPIKNLSELTSMHHCILTPIREEFVEQLLEKNNINNIEIDEIKLSNKIYEKSNGNGLYCKYLIDHASINSNRNSFEWMVNLPAYDFNLKGYYEYLYEQIKLNMVIPYAFCGADFSLSINDLKEITGLGNFVSRQLEVLSPILRLKPKFGYSIYHESYKRFVIEYIKKEEISIDRWVYEPLIRWLERFPFYESTKSYGHLLKLYFEIDDFKAISKTISLDFIEKSLFHAQPISIIQQNHLLQRSTLSNFPDFEKIIILSEQSKIVYEIESLGGSTLIQYLKAVQAIHGSEIMNRALWNEDDKLIDIEDVYRLLVEQVYQKKDIVHWTIAGEIPQTIPFEMLGEISVRYLYKKEYEEFDDLFKKLVENPDYHQGIKVVQSEIKWYCIHFGNDWIEEVSYYKNYIKKSSFNSSNLIEAINKVINSDRVVYREDWRSMFDEIALLSQKANKEVIDKGIKLLSDYNWFRNWLIYFIKINSFERKDKIKDELINAFSYLVRDLEPFKGEPRVSDLYSQNSYIRKSFYKGLLLCKSDNDLLIECSNLLEKVTQTVTSIQKSYHGPLTESEFLKLISYYLPSDYVLSKYKDYSNYLEGGRLYGDIAGISFEFSRVLSLAGKKEEALEKYNEGIHCLTAYGFRKDRTFSEILFCSSPYQNSYNSLDKDWFYNLYEMAMTVVTHTDGKSTNHYPVEWFEEFIKVFPDEALRILACETLEGEQSHWWQENQFKHVLRKNMKLFTPTQWFLLMKSLPLEHSEDIIDIGLDNIDFVHENIEKAFLNWLELIPNINLDYKRDNNKYSKELSEKYRFKIGRQLFPIKEKRKRSENLDKPKENSEVFPNSSFKDALEFLDSNDLTKEHLSIFSEVINKTKKISDKRELFLKYVEQFRYGGYSEEFDDKPFETGTTEWIYFNMYLFVFITDGWGGLMHHTRFFKEVYNFDAKIAISTLMEILGELLSKPGYVRLVSCNLIKTLSEVQYEESEVRPLLKLTHKLVKKRLPYPPNLDINLEILSKLEDLNRDELVVALLISRLKTLTTQKTQGIIWSLTYIAKTAHNNLFKPFSWAFSNKDYLLPIHRALLLQILVEYVDKELIPDSLLAVLMTHYPTGYFLEDQFVRYFVNYKIDFGKDITKGVIHNKHKYDDILGYSHVKYGMLSSFIGCLDGAYYAYSYGRDLIPEKYREYFDRSEKLVTPITPLANVAYEIVNNHFYEQLSSHFNSYFLGSTFGLDFYLSEIILEVGSSERRPDFLPEVQDLSSFEIKESNNILKKGKWCILASKETIITGKNFEDKKRLSSSITFTKSNNKGRFFSKYLFKIEQFYPGEVHHVQNDNPICKIEIKDALENTTIIFVSPWIIRELNLTVNQEFHTGLRACDNNGDTIIKMINWKEDYIIRMSDSIEIPKKRGVAVLIRTDYYDKLLDLYDGNCQYVFQQSSDRDKT